MRDEHAKKHDQAFWVRFGLVLAGLVLFTFICILLARMIAPSRTDLVDQVKSPEAIEERIRPIGQLLTSDSEYQPVVAVSDASATTASASVAVSAAPAVAAFDGKVDGKQVYTEACLLCHGSGLAGAPIPGDQASWGTRLEQGVEALYQNALNGIRGMPARGGRLDLSDEQVKASVDYMLSVN